MALPAAFNPAGALGFEPLKASILRVGALLLAAAWLASRVSGASGRTALRDNPVVRAGFGLIALSAISTALSVEPTLSLFGAFDRGTGWLTLAADAIVFVVAADLLQDARRRERAITAMLIGAIIPCAYLLLQRVGLDPITWNTLGAPGSTLASPTFLGSYLVIVAPFAAYRVVSSARNASIGYAGSLALLLVICAVTLLTTIRGPLLGLLVALMSFAVLANRKRKVGRLEAAGAVAVLVIGLGLAVVATGSTGIAGLQRFANIARAGDSSVERLTVWKDAARVPLGDLPRMLLGYGPDAQKVVLERGEATVRLTQNQVWDRAHTLLLDTWLTGGVLGVVALLALLALAVRAAWRARAGDAGLLPVAIVAALAGHIVEVSFAFETVVSSTLFWFVLALAASLAPSRTRVRRMPATLAGAGALVALVLAPLLATPAIADQLYGRARRADYVMGARLEEQAAQWAPWVEELPRAAALDWQRVATVRDDVTASSRAQADLLEAAARAPAEPLPRQRLARFYLLRGDLDLAEQACERALERGPYRWAAWDTCADVSLAQGRTDLSPVRRARGEELRKPLPT